MSVLLLFLHENICCWFSFEAHCWDTWNEYPQHTFSWRNGGWSGGAKVLCILHHWGVQLILAYSWARPAILVVGKGRGGMFLFLLFLHFHSCSSFFPVPLFHLLYSLSSISFLPFSGRRHKMTLKGWRVVKPQHNQSIMEKWENYQVDIPSYLDLWQTGSMSLLV